MGTNQDDLLFSPEKKLIESCRSEITADKYGDNILLPRYKELLDSYEKLLRFTRKVTRISDTQGNALKERERKMKSLLDNSNQGFLTFGVNLLVDEEYSSECAAIFGKQIKKENITLLLSTRYDEQQKYEDAFNAVFKEKDREKLEQLPSRIIINNRYIDVKYKLINWLDKEYAIFVILTDVTDKIKSEAKVKYLIEHDSLTSLYNRSYIDKIIPEMLISHNLPISVILADMNALKLANDVFGHQTGDRLIIKVAEILKNCCRKTDIVARWGGDEFLVILPNAWHSQCLRIVELINRACQQEDQEVVDISEVVPISVSMGTATMESLDLNITELFAVAENRMYKNKLLDNKTVRKNIIKKMETVLEAKGIVPPGHIERLKKLSVKFAGFLGFSEESVETTELLLLSSLHDAGKVAVPEDMLNKEQKDLTSEELEIMRSYPEAGYRMAQSIGEPGVAEAILALCERWDGNGYPHGLKGAQIPYISRIFSVLKSFDLMTGGGAFESDLSKEEALDEIRNQSGLQFDPGLTKLFCDNLSNL